MRLFEDRVENRNEVAGRGIDDLQYLSNRLLLLQRLAQFGQQPRILDRDHRLVGEGAHQFDLPLGERLRSLACEPGNSNRLGPSQKGDAECRADLPEAGRLRHSIVRVGADVHDMDNPALERSPAGNGAASGSEGLAPDKGVVVWRQSVTRCHPINLAGALGEARNIRFAQPRRSC